MRPNPSEGADLPRALAEQRLAVVRRVRARAVQHHPGAGHHLLHRRGVAEVAADHPRPAGEGGLQPRLGGGRETHRAGPECTSEP